MIKVEAGPDKAASEVLSTGNPGVSSVAVEVGGSRKERRNIQRIDIGTFNAAPSELRHSSFGI